MPFNSKHRIKTFSVKEVEELEGWAARQLRADLPLAYRRRTGIQQRCENCLANFDTLAQRTDLLTLVLAESASNPAP